MRTKSLFGVKSITNLIYGLLMIAPFVAILSRVIYVQANPNAKDSYSDKYVSNIAQLTTVNEYISGLDIQFNYWDNSNASGVYSAPFYFSSISFNPMDYGFSQTAENYDYVQFYPYHSEAGQYSHLRLHNINTNSTENKGIWGNQLKQFSITLSQNVASNGNVNNSVFKAYTFTYVKISLDNAFEYSLSSFTQDNDIGVINFFGWFEGMFLNQSNAHNMVYLNFVNWYMNYALLVSSSYLLFLALIWFVNYIRRILDKSMNHDFGGF